ncbi:uncharacterized protein LOC106644406 isoform X2 [Copidosoma floridanum]|uniref:uncharacterized protein LOC106644406 isoform X2 n=1 Tax=Copidosoma floridanum TaxID=29053 RepID=UPI0006C9819C|nr:uncharacterized protein LOC106644406 isoform X2 [Copidosoma floridanum]
MDKWRSSNGRGSGNKPSDPIRAGDTLLPPTRRALATCTGPSPAPLDKRRHKKWSFDGILRRFASYLDAQSSSSTSSLEDPTNRPRRQPKGKSAKGNRRTAAGYAGRVNDNGIDCTPACVYGRAEDLVNANAVPLTMTSATSHHQHLDVVRQHHSRSCSDGSLEGARSRQPRRAGNVKARAEAKRDRLRVIGTGSSSTEGLSSNEESYGIHQQQRLSRNGEPVNGKRRSRASRTERYLKRICNGTNAANGTGNKLEVVGARSTEFQPIERAPRTGYAKDYLRGIHANGNDNNNREVMNENYCYARASDIGVNPLVQQTLQYFSEFDRHMEAQQRTYPGPRNHCAYQERRNHTRPQAVGIGDRATVHAGVQTDVPQVPPKPPSRDHRSKIFEKPESIDRYIKCHQRVLGTAPKDYDRCSPRPVAQSPNSEVRTIIESSHSPRDPLRESSIGSASRDCPGEEGRNDGESSYYEPEKQRSPKNLEEALNELEAIYNSLQLGDEELLERAEKRSMEEFHYRGITAASPEDLARDLASRRRTWAESVMGEPDRLKDDMAYRRMHPKERPSSVDGQSSLSSISYLMTSPIPSHRDEYYPIDPARRPPNRRKEPDVTLDDVVFRSMQYANSTLKVAEPQPPFGIPLGPITTAAESDYLHTKPSSPRSRSPYVPSCEPDLVTDDLAFRSLRKDALQSSQQPSRQSSPSLGFPPSPPSWQPKRTTRSLSANIYGIINPPGEPRRTSDPELLPTAANPWRRRDGKNEPTDDHATRRTTNNPNQEPHRGKDDSSEVSAKSYDESSDERIQPQSSLRPLPADPVYKVGSDRGSSYLSSSCSSLPGTSRNELAQPVAEQGMSVYEKLCQDLENLVQLTKGIDGESTTADDQGDKVAGSGCPEEGATPNKSEELIGDGVEGETKGSSSVGESGKVVESEIAALLEVLKGVAGDGDSSCSRRRDDVAKDELEVANKGTEDNTQFLASIEPTAGTLERRRTSLNEGAGGSGVVCSSHQQPHRHHWEGMNKCNHKYHSMPAKTSSLLPFRLYGSKRKSSNRKSLCTVS